MEGKAYFKDYEVHYYEIDYKKRLLLTSLLDYFGDAATYHSEELGVGIEYLKENKLAWVLYSWDINIHRFPLFGEKIIIKTVPYAFKKFYALRKFEVKDENQNIIATADSIWLLINTERRRPIRVMKELYEAYGIDVNSFEDFNITKLESLKESSGEKTFDVRYSDIDTNRHVNNAKYVAWAIETVPMDIILNYTLKSVKINYEKETYYGETVTAAIKVIKDGNKIICLHKITNVENAELTLLQTVWR